MKKLFSTLLLLIACTISFAETSFNSLEKLTQTIKEIAYERNQTTSSLTDNSKTLPLIKERQHLLNDALEKNLKEITPLLLTPEIVRSFSKAEQAHMEKNIHNLTGYLEIRMAIGKGFEYPQYVLKKGTALYFLYFQGKISPELKTGTKITIREAFLLKHTAGYQQIILDMENVSIDKQPINTVNTDAFGPQNTVVLLLNFQDAPNNKPWSIATIQNLVFNTINKIYADFSYNQINFVGQVYGFFTIPMNSNADCNTSILSQLPTLAETAARNQGISLDSYTRRIYIFPTTSSCRWAGVGTIGRTTANGSIAYSETWINGYIDYNYLAHELGHNMALFHSNSLQCSNGTSNQGSCTIVQYGDLADTMGQTYGHFNAYQKESIGWLGYNNSPAITTVTSNGTYTIEPYETASKNSKALKILKKANADGSNDYYYVEFRQPIGYDADLTKNCASCDMFKGVLVHQGNDKNKSLIQLLDMTPQDNDLETMVLLPGMTFQDTTADNGGINITTNSISLNGASVTVSFGRQKNCVRKPAMVNYDPYQPQVVSKGQATTITVTITNNDSSDCPDSTFNVTSIPKDSSLVTNVPTPNITLKPNGGKGSIKVLITPSATAPTGIALFATTYIKDTVLNRPQQFNTQITVKK